MPHRKPLILLITSGYHLYREYLLRLVSARARIWLLCDAPPTWEHPYIEGHSVVDTLDVDAMVAVALSLACSPELAGVLCWDEVKMVHTARVARALSLPGSDPAAVSRCRDKHLTRSALAVASVPQAESVIVSTEDEARGAAGGIGYPVVLKPRALGASFGVSLAHHEGELAAAYARARGAREDGVPYYDEGVLVEEFLEGPEISIDSACHDGHLEPMFVARKVCGFPPYFEEVGHTIDAEDPLLRDSRLVGVLRDAHRAVGFTDGITHTEVRLTSAGPKIVEINARLGGDMIPYVGLLATGVDPGAAAVDVACGLAPVLTRRTDRVGSIRFLYPEQDAVVQGLTIDEHALPESVHLVRPLAQPGQELLLPPRGNVTCRYAYAIAVAQTLAECEAGLAAAERATQLTTSDPTNARPAVAA